jgi:hypothetical protein
MEIVLEGKLRKSAIVKDNIVKLVIKKKGSLPFSVGK